MLCAFWRDSFSASCRHRGTPQPSAPQDPEVWSAPPAGGLTAARELVTQPTLPPPALSGTMSCPPRRPLDTPHNPPGSAGSLVLLSEESMAGRLA